MKLTSFLKHKILKNAAWIMLGRIIHMALSLVIGIMTARYLEPTNFGLINYAAVYTTFFASVCTLGINSVIVKNFVDHPDEEGETLGTAFGLRLMSSLFSMAMIVGIVFLIDGDEALTVWVTMLYCIGLIFQVADTFNYWFQSRLQSKYYAIATLVSYLIASAYRIVLLATGKSVAWFAVSNSIDYAIVALLTYVFYRRQGGPRFSFSWRKARELLRVSKSYIISGLMVSIYAGTDKFMLKHLLDEATVGYYATASAISVMWAFILSAFIDSMNPSIMRQHKENRQRFEQTNRQLYALVFYFSVVMSLGIMLFSDPIVRLLYGSQYQAAVAPLRIIVWYTAFSYLGVARNAWMVCEDKQKYLKYLYISAAAINVVLNFALIPLWGACGAAAASLITQISTTLLLPFLIRPLRENGKMMIDAICLRGVFPPRQKES